MHTSQVSACASSTGADQARAYKARGYTGIIVTDHFINGYSTCPAHLSWEEKMRFVYKGYEAAKKEGDKIGLDVFYGWEFNIRGSDFLTYGLDLDFLIKHKDIDRMQIEPYSDLVRKSGGYLAQAHPYRVAYYIENPYPVSPGFIDGIEVFNSSMDDATNNKALAFAKKHNLARQAGSDSHHEQVAAPSGILLQKRAENIHDIVHALKNHEAGLITM
jgi:hypothetical protein